MNEFKIIIRYFFWVPTGPSHPAPGYHEVSHWAGFIVHDQIARSDWHVNVPRRTGARLDDAAKLPVRAGPEAVTVHKATHQRAFQGEKRDDNE